MLTAHQRTRLHRQEFLDTAADVHETQPGPLTAEDLDAYRKGHVRRPYIPAGVDQQGRYPQAAESSTEIGAEEDRDDSLAVFVGARNALLMMAAIALCIGFVVWVLR